MKRKIKWEKWVDPIQKAIDEGKLDYFTRISDSPVSVTPMGIIPVNNCEHPSQIFNMWVGHTSFSITQHIAELISAEPGVEGFDPFSRYRFRIVIGEQFSEEAVKKSIEMTLAREHGHEKVINFLHTNAKDDWAFVITNQSLYCYHSNRQSEVESWLLNFSGVPASIYSSWGLCHHESSSQDSEDRY